ncbi:MAG TPA: transglutaminase domain-containing protein [Candidatus Saccharimonadales bacterium]|nr:transglutaminase domain-containing protein [Candidatus Saccharimonadales bacterium]
MRPKAASLMALVLLGSLAGPVLPASAAGGAPRVFRAPGDSVLISVGDSRQWVKLAGVPSPDTTFLGPDNDLVLWSRVDSVTIPRSVGRADVRFARAADTLAEVFFFESRSAHDRWKYQALLNRYARFGSAPLPQAAEFDDRPAHDPDAAGLRALFPIDSIAGGGGDLERMRNLLHWVHTGIRWDGTRENPKAATLAASVDACVRLGQTMNCGGLAEAYAAACRAAGFAARRIVCLPFDAQDPDCHSVTIVYSDSLRRWVYMDPTFEACWTDSRGNFLDLEAARALLAAGDTVVVNPGANVNGDRRDPAEHLAYMSKNLFRFKAWLASGKAICLNPSGFAPSDSAAAESPSGAREAKISTDNPALFWAPPKGRGGR